MVRPQRQGADGRRCSWGRSACSYIAGISVVAPAIGAAAKEHSSDQKERIQQFQGVSKQFGAAAEGFTALRNAS